MVVDLTESYSGAFIFSVAATFLASIAVFICYIINRKSDKTADNRFNEAADNRHLETADNRHLETADNCIPDQLSA